MNRCLFGDCRESMRALIADGVRVQMCVTSPPYWGLRDYGVAGQLGLESSLADYIGAMVEVFGLVRELLADDGTLWLNLGDIYAGNRNTRDALADWSAENARGGGHQITESRRRDKAPCPRSDVRIPGLKPKDLVGLPWRVAFALQADGWYLRSDIIWHKPNPMPESAGDRPTSAHEHLFLLSKQKQYYYDADAIAVQTSSDSLARVRRGSSFVGGRTDGAPYGYQREPVAGKTSNKRDVWTVASQPYSRAHYATYPPKLIKPCILAGSRPGDIVLDPFLGSGTTAQVAQELGRQWIGCELNEQNRALQDERTSQQGLTLQDRGAL